MGLCKGGWEPEDPGPRGGGCSSEYEAPQLPGSCVLSRVPVEAAPASYQARLLGRILAPRRACSFTYRPLLVVTLSERPSLKRPFSTYIHVTPTSLLHCRAFIMLQSAHYYPTCFFMYVFLYIVVSLSYYEGKRLSVLFPILASMLSTGPET